MGTGDETRPVAQGSSDTSDAGSDESWLRAIASTSDVASSAPLRPGQKLAGERFELVRAIGEGGMGVVYEAFDPEHFAHAMCPGFRGL